ncbi:MAG TPA: FmdB family zinc ribbon protein [Trebonia sp.]|nr:FmdB family zinc ribbon protein [Trebonia sp.]
MPTYQYVCTECGDQVEAVQKFTDDPLTVHDACGGRLRKVFSPVGIVFKGSGFYRTDSRKGSSAPTAASPSSSGDSPSSAGDKKTGDGDKKTGEKSSSSSSSASSSSSSSSGSSSSGSSGEKVA